MSPPRSPGPEKTPRLRGPRRGPRSLAAAGIVVFLCSALLGTEVLRRQTSEELPDARRGDASTALRAGPASLAERRGRGSGTAAAEQPLSEQLEHLAPLRDRAAITATEYDSAKAALLHA